MAVTFITDWFPGMYNITEGNGGLGYLPIRCRHRENTPTLNTEYQKVKFKFVKIDFVTRCSRQWAATGYVFGFIYFSFIEIEIQHKHFWDGIYLFLKSEFRLKMSSVLTICSEIFTTDDRSLFLTFHVILRYSYEAGKILHFCIRKIKHIYVALLKHVCQLKTDKHTTYEQLNTWFVIAIRWFLVPIYER